MALLKCQHQIRLPNYVKNQFYALLKTRSNKKEFKKIIFNV